jgi:hypothetical protein
MKGALFVRGLGIYRQLRNGLGLESGKRSRTAAWRSSIRGRPRGVWGSWPGHGALTPWATGPDAVMRFATRSRGPEPGVCFLDQLKYLAAGGRISKTKGFFGDLLHMKPIITPAATGAEKVGVVRNRDDQLAFALARLKAFSREDSPLDPAGVFRQPRPGSKRRPPDGSGPCCRRRKSSSGRSR